MKGPIDTSVEIPVPGFVAVIDVRGFSKFSEKQEDPADIARYINITTKYVLTELDKSAFLESCWIKLLGDGLLIVRDMKDCQQEKIINIVKGMTKKLVDLSNSFPAFIEQSGLSGTDSMPTTLGIGISYGILVPIYIRSDQFELKTKDYIGRAINLASRLQQMASGGCIAHSNIYDRLLGKDKEAAVLFKTSFKNRHVVYVQGIGEETVYSTGKIPEEYLKLKGEEELLEQFSKKSLKALRAAFTRKRNSGSTFIQLPESTRFIFIKKEGENYLEKFQLLTDEKIYFRKKVVFPANKMVEGIFPVLDAIVKRRPVIVSYSVRCDHCDPADPNNEYWKQTKERFPHASIDTFRELASHPSSVLCIPLFDQRNNEIIGVVVFDSVDLNVFNDEIADEMNAILPIIYDQLFGTTESEHDEIIRFQ